MAVIELGNFLNDARKALKTCEDDAVEKVKEIARALNEELMARTPVWTGQTVRNYVWYAWGAGGGSGSVREAIGSNPKDLVGTGFMPLGTEPRRADNEAAVREELEGVLADYTKLGRSIVVMNFSPTWDLVDSGSAPTPDRARNPGGVSNLAEQVVRAQFGDIF